MPPATTRQALLKVISGPHAGAELLLSEGRNTIGRDDACDIVLHDGTLAECHAAFEVSNGTVTVEAVEESPLHVDGQPTPRLQLRPFQIVTIGETHLAIGPSNEPWPSLVPPTIIAAAAPTAEPAVAQPHAGSAKPHSPVAIAPTRNRSSGIAAVSIAAVVLLLFGWWWNMGDVQPTTSAADARADLRKRLDEVLKRFQTGSDLSIDEKPSGLAVNGYVATPEVRRELATAIKELPAVRNNVVDTAGLAEAAGRVLKMHKVDFATEPGRPGEVIVSGVTKDLASWNRVKSRVAADVPRIRTLTDHVRRPGEIPAPPKPQITQPVPVVQAEPPPQPGPQPSPEPAAPAAVSVAPPTEPAVTLKIRSITVGTFRSLVLESGEKVFEGAVLPSGHTIKSIAADKVILEKNGQESVVAVGGGT